MEDLHKKKLKMFDCSMQCSFGCQSFEKITNLGQIKSFKQMSKLLFKKADAMSFLRQFDMQKTKLKFTFISH